MGIRVDVQHAEADLGSELPSDAVIRSWVRKTLAKKIRDASLCIRIINTEEMQSLNRNYRKKDYPTNVLSFPMDTQDDDGGRYLGDILICGEVVKRESIEQKKTSHAHWAHIVVHGVLHLLGYDHIDETDAETMENLEIGILKTLGFSNPYDPPV